MSNARKLADNLPTEGSLSGRNIIVNGAQTIDQRNNGSAITKNGGHQYATDRFVCRLIQSSSSTFQRVVDAPSGFYNSMKVTIGTGASPSSGDGGNYFSYVAEGQDSSYLKWGSSSAKTVTLSFWVKCSIAGAFSIMIGNNALSRSYPTSYTINSANTWEYKTITVTGDTSGTWPTDNTGGLRVMWDWGNGSNFKGTANAWASADYRGGATGGTALCATSGATWQITGVQMEVGPQSTPFEHELVGVTLHKCQRYYIKHVINNINGQIVMSQDRGTSTYYGQLNFMQEMRVAPTVTGTGIDRVHKPGVVYDTIATGPLFYQASVNGMYILAVSTNTHATSSTAFLGANNGGSINIDAEL